MFHPCIQVVFTMIENKTTKDTSVPAGTMFQRIRRHHLSLWAVFFSRHAAWL